jgi:hypothetical protein
MISLGAKLNISSLVPLRLDLAGALTSIVGSYFDSVARFCAPPLHCQGYDCGAALGFSRPFALLAVSYHSLLGFTFHFNVKAVSSTR